MTELSQEMPKVLVRGLKKQYGDNVVLKSIDLTIPILSHSQKNPSSNSN